MDEGFLSKLLYRHPSTTSRHRRSIISSLVRSSSLKETGRQSSGYADHQSALVTNMLHTDDNERPTRTENRLYSFLTRSRSRSRSNKDTPPAAPMNLASPPPGSKPPTRVQSRPLSTSTNTTITPATPKPKRRAAPTGNTPTPTATRRPATADNNSPKPRRRFQDLFGLSLGSLSRSRSRSRSRPSSPVHSGDVPPLPGTDDDATPRPRKSFSPTHARFHGTRSPSPTPAGPKVLRVVNATATTSSSTGSTAASIKITKLFTKADAPPPPKRVSSLHRRSMKETPSPELPPPRITHTPATPLVRNGESAANGGGTLPKSSRAPYHVHAMKGSLDSGFRYRGAAGTMGVLDEEARSASELSAHAKGKARQVDSTSPTPPRSGAVSPPLPPLPIARPGPIRMSSSARSTKHGSFDFERPGWVSGVGVGVGAGASGMQRTGSNGTTASGLSTILDKERESAMGPGLAGVGTLQREQSMKREQEREEARDKAKSKGKAPTPSQRTTPSDQHASTSTNGKNSSVSKATGKQRLTGPHTRNAKGGSLAGPGPGPGVARLVGGHHGLFSFEPPVASPTRSTGSTGTGAASLTAHDLAPGDAEWNLKDKAEREFERVQLEKERERQRQRDVRRGLRGAGDRAPVPVPLPIGGSLSKATGRTMASSGAGGGASAYAGHRSGTKGRSLDLGLGLAWASSKVPEKALLASASLFTRTPSGGSNSGHGHGYSTQTNTQGTSSNGNGQSSNEHSTRSRGGRSTDGEGDRSKLGREVAEVFRNALDGEGYRVFKSYVHQFDAHEIPFDGPTGIVSLVDKLLSTATHLDEKGRRKLLDKFVKIILQQA